MKDGRDGVDIKKNGATNEDVIKREETIDTDREKTN